MNTLPVDRALSIYETLADRSAVRGTRERLSQHLMKIYLEGEKDPHRLTVHGLSYLRDFDREIELAKLNGQLGMGINFVMCPPSPKLRRRSLGAAGCRASTFQHSDGKQDVDGRDKPGHDGEPNWQTL